MSDTIEGRRERTRIAVSRFRDRRRDGAILVTIEVRPHVLRALERLALLGSGDRDKDAVAVAVERFLQALPGFVSMGDAVWPEQGDG